MLERIHKLLKRLEFCKGPSADYYCPSCAGRRNTLMAHYPGCELKACLDDLEAAIAKTEENES